MISTKNFFVVIALLIIFLIPASSFAFNPEKISIDFGTAENQLMYLNKSVKGFSESYAMGPFDFFISGNKAAVLDWFNAAIKIFDESGSLVEKIELSKLLKSEGEGAKKISPYATSLFIKNNGKKDEIYAGDSNLGKVYKIADGKIEKTFGKRGTGPFEFTQIEQVAVTKTGDILIGDCMNNKMAVISKEGKNIRELSWKSYSGFAFDENGSIYLVKQDKDGFFACYSHEIATGVSRLLFKFQKSGWRNARILGKNSAGNLIIAFFDQSGQKALALNNKGDKAPFGYVTIALFTRDGIILASYDLKVNFAVGNQFYYDEASNTVYYQDYNPELAPAGKYKIGSLKLVMPKDTPAPDVSAYKNQKEAFKLNYSPAPKSDCLTGGFKSIVNCMPILRSDYNGAIYLLDRAGKKVIVFNDKGRGEIDLNKYFKGADLKIDDFFAVAADEMYFLDNSNGGVYRLTLKAKPETYFYKFATHGIKNINKIFVNKNGLLALESSIDRAFYYMDGRKKFEAITKTPEIFCALTRESNLALLFENETGLKLNFYDYKREQTTALKGFNIPLGANRAGAVARFIGDDANKNSYLAAFDGPALKLMQYAPDGKKLFETEFSVPAVAGFIDSSLAPDFAGNIYVGVPTDENYVIYKVKCNKI